MSKKTRTSALVTRRLAGKTSTGNRSHLAASTSPLQQKKAVIAQRWARAKRAISAGEKSWRIAADEIAANIADGATQMQAAAAVGKSQPWVNRLLRWRKNGFTKGGPFAEGNAKRKLLLGVINRLLRCLPNYCNRFLIAMLCGPISKPRMPNWSPLRTMRRKPNSSTSSSKLVAMSDWRSQHEYRPPAQFRGVFRA